MKKKNKEFVKAKIFGHEHLVTLDDIAQGIIPVVAKLLHKAGFRESLAKTLRKVFFWSDTDDLDRIANFLLSVGLSRKDLFKRLKTFGNTGDEYVIITIDQEFMGRGKVPKSYRQQILEVTELIDAGEPIKLVVHIDPRRKNYMGLLYEFENYISGVKMYNYMGYFPYDIRLQPLWKKCAKKKWFVVFHCSPGNINWYGGKDIDMLLKHSKYPLYKTGKSNKEKSKNFGNPLGMINVAIDNPKVNFIIEHLGGKEEAEKYWRGEKDTWTELLIEAATENPNIYLGTSFTTYTKPMQMLVGQVLKRLPKQLIWGCDYNVCESEAFVTDYTQELRKEIGDENFYMIANNIRKLL